MEFSYAYKGSSSASPSGISFAPDTKREPTYFSAGLQESLAFREGISALHDVVVSDLRWQPKDRSAYLEWVAGQEQRDVEALLASEASLATKIRTLQGELSELRRKHDERLRPFYKARDRYFRWLYKVNKDAWFVLDPVITVHPDEVFFECFSLDESSYGRLGASFEVFKDIHELSYGTTNVDYSDGLYQEFQKIRSYRDTRFEVDPSGFEVQTTDEEAMKEVKIDLPDSWVRGFLQVSSAMALPGACLRLQPMDVHNLCFVLRRHKAKQSPRSLRWHLEPGQPIRATFEPFGIEFTAPRSIYEGDQPREIRQWGRRRLLILERLIPVAREFRVHLLGTGMPSFWVADLGPISFTLGLSGWTANDWSGSANFDLLAPRADVDSETQRKVLLALQGHRLSTPDDLAAELSLDRAQVLGALSAWTQAGRAIYDLNKDVFRHRELAREPLPMGKLRFQNEREEQAASLVQSGMVSVARTNVVDADTTRVEGRVRARGRKQSPWLVLDSDERISDAACDCYYFGQNKLFKGPCEHILALRIAFARRRNGRSS